MSQYYPQASVELRILPEDFQLVSDASKQATKTLHVVARDVTINVNDYKTTDTFSMDIDYKHFPFDPRSIRSCGVVIYLQDMEKLYNEDGSINTIVPGRGTKLDPKTPNSVFIGFVDEESIDFDDSKRSVRFEGRDITALLIDQKYQTNSPLVLNQPLDTILNILLSTFAATSKIAVVNLTNTKLPTLAQYYPDFGSPMAGQKNVGQHESYWEIIQDIVSRCGLICYMGNTVSGNDLVPALFLNTPRNQATNVDDIKFIYGINVKNLKFKRKLGRFKNFNVQVRSRVGKEVLIAKIPEEATVEWGKAFGFQYDPTLVGGPGATPLTTNFAPVSIPVLKPDGSLDASSTHVAPYITFNVPNISDKDQLIRIGQTLYEQYSLQQLEGSFDTFEMVGRGSTTDAGVNQFNSLTQYDLTKIKKGQTICLEINTDDLSRISRFNSVSDRTKYLIENNYDKEVAAIFASTMGKFSARFQIKSYSMHVNQDSGFKLSVNFQNIIDLINRGFK